MTLGFAPDGWSTGVHLGLVVPHADLGPEAEAQALVGQDATIHASRVHFSAMRDGGEMDVKIPHQPVGDFTQPPHIDHAVQILAAAPLNAIGLAFTSSSYKHGLAGETELLQRLWTVARGIPLSTTCIAARAAFKALGVDRIALFNPPWFDNALNELGVSYFSEVGVQVGHCSAVNLPSVQKAITPSHLADYVAGSVGDEDAVFIAGNGQPAVAVISSLEGRIGRPVLTANQVLVWKMLADAGVALAHGVYGALSGVRPFS